MDTSGRIHLTPEALKQQEQAVADALRKLTQEQAAFELKQFKDHLESLGLNVTSAIPENAIPIRRLPDKDCKNCYGRGFIRRIIQNVREIDVCECVT